MEIKELADSFAKRYRSRNPFEIIRGLNIILIPIHLMSVRAFYQYFQRNNIIYIDDSLSQHEQAFECAHELGHMLMHKKANAIFMDTRTNFKTSKFENEADTFAMDFLVDDVTLLEYHTYTDEQLAHILGYDKRLIDLRIKEFERGYL